jgi:type IV pilus assembly protein PilB
VAIFEVLELDDDFHPLLHTGSAEKMKQLAREKGMPLLFDDGIRRAHTGATTLEEVFRVAFAN